MKLVHSIMGVALVVGGCTHVQEGWSNSPNGMREEFTFYFKGSEQVHHGTLKRYRGDGSLLELQHFTHGTPSGQWETYWPSGRVKGRITWHEGTPVEEKQFDENGVEIELQNK